MSSKMRLSGLISGMDTESIISALVSTRRVKVDKKKGEQTKHSWKQEIWKDLNKELKSLHSTVANLRFSSAYAKKTTSVSDPTKASVITGDGATNSVQSLQIKELAKTAYKTGGEIDKSATALTTLGELGFSGNGTIKVAERDLEFNVDASTTISDVLSKLQGAGLNASFDAKNHRLFVSSKESGEAGNFTMTGANDDGADALAKLGLQDASYYSGATSFDANSAEGAAKIDSTVASRLAANLDAYNKAIAARDSLNDKISKLEDSLGLSGSYDTEALIETSQKKVDDLKKELEEMSEDDDKEAYEAKKAEIEAAEKELGDLQSLSASNIEATKNDDRITALEQNFKEGTLVADADGKYTAEASDALKEAVKRDYESRAEAAAGMDTTKAMKSIEGTNAKITLNGADFESNTNVFEVNGLTITAMGKTGDDEITLSTQNDTAGVYDQIKNFLKSYNTIMNKMDALYNAESASKYDVLTDDEKDAMSEKEVEKYEQKIKDSLLRRDSTIGTLTNSLYDAMTAGIDVNGKTMHLSYFGINTLSYFEASDNEKHAFHIDGDPDDEKSSGNTDILKGMIASDPDTVVSFFTQLSQKLYKNMSDLSSSVNGTRTYGTFYEDKKMATEYTDFTTKISDMEKKVNDYEDKLYKQYAAMEKALAKLQSNSSAVTGLLGGN